MRVTVARRLAAVALIGVGSLGTVAGIAEYGSARQGETTEAMAQISAGLSRQWNADMMHDGIRADVMSALYARSGAQRAELEVDSVGEKSAAMVEHLEDIARNL